MPRKDRLGASGAVAVVTAVASLFVVVVGCQTNVSLGDPDAASGDGGVVVSNKTDPPPCLPSDPYRVLAALDPALGDLRALATSSSANMIAGIFSGGSLAVTSTTGGAFRVITAASSTSVPDPIALALAPDGSHAWIAGRAGEVRRIRISDGNQVIASQQTGVTGITVTSVHGLLHAFWTRPQNDAVMTWDFASLEGPRIAATFSRAQSIASDGTAIYFAGVHTLAALGPDDAAPRKFASTCGANPITVDRNAVYCIDDGSLLRVDVTTGSVLTLAGGIRAAKEVVVARGRAIFRVQGANGATIESVPIDGIGGPTVLDVVPPNGFESIATDGCGLYYSVGSNVSRRAL